MCGTCSQNPHNAALHFFFKFCSLCPFIVFLYPFLQSRWISRNIVLRVELMS